MCADDSSERFMITSLLGKPERQVQTWPDRLESGPHLKLLIPDQPYLRQAKTPGSCLKDSVRLW